MMAQSAATAHGVAPIWSRCGGRGAWALAIHLLLLLLLLMAGAGATVWAAGPGASYVCPPCSADCHGPEHAWREPGTCPVCGMALVVSEAETETRLDEEIAQRLAYQGVYAYEEDGTVAIVVSPADGGLYVQLDGARYPLRPTDEADAFLNVPGDRVVFVRAPSGAVLGYRVPDSGDDRLFPRRSDIETPAETWFPRVAAREAGWRYDYAVPAAHNDGLRVGPLRAGVLVPERIRTMVQEIAEGAYPGVHGVLLLQGGTLVLEEYFYEYDHETIHPLRSATKSVVSALVGIAIEQGRIGGPDSPVLPFFAEDHPSIANLDEAKKRITVGDLLTQRSGLACDDWDPASPGHEVAMGQSEDWVKFVLDLPMLDTPGSTARYCSGGVVLLGRIVEKAVGMRLEAFAEAFLFGPLGIDRYDWRFDPDRSSAATFVQLSLRPRDMAKLGLLYAERGRWQGRQVLSEAWVDASLARHATVGDTDYGYLWWRPYLNVPGGRHHGMSAQGNGGQEIQLWPELDLIVVFTGGNYNRSSPTNRLLVDHVLPTLDGPQGERNP